MRDIDNLYRIAMQSLATRYRYMAYDLNDIELYNFIAEFEDGVITDAPLLKLNRWLGYIQGVLITKGATTVTTERDFTRPLFRPLDFPGES